MRHFVFIIVLLFNFGNIFSQGHYWVFFTDKAGVSFNPYQYFDKKAIERRIREGISLYDYSDFPVNQRYVDSVAKYVEGIAYVSRWFNAVAVHADEKQIERIKTLPFVDSIRPIYIPQVEPCFWYDTTLSYREFEILKWQTDTLGSRVLHNHKLTGKGVRIAVFDIGFKGVDKLKEFEHLHILKTYDFTKKKDFVYYYNNHGTMVLSCIAGHIGNRYGGLAPDAEFLLAKTEVRGEPFSEEVNWEAAAEWADKNGADIINSSLGYTYQRYYPYQMDGNTSLVAYAANIAARKGIIVVNSIGNEADTRWKVLATPADADSVFSVGGIAYNTGLHIDFSSYGPNARCVPKPDVVAPAEVIAASPTGWKLVQGTSFSAPLITGYIACIKQAFPHKHAWQIKNIVRQSASLYPYYDYAHGYGVPNAKNIFSTDTLKHDSLFSITYDDSIVFHFSYFSKNGGTYLFYKITVNGCIREYYVVDIYSPEYSIPYPDYNDFVLEAFYHGTYYKKHIFLNR